MKNLAITVTGDSYLLQRIVFIDSLNGVLQGSSLKRAERIDEIDPSNLTQIILAEG